MTTPFIEKDNGFYYIHYGYDENLRTSPLTSGDLIDIRKSIDMALEENGLMVNVHSWNGLIVVNSEQIRELYGCPAHCLKHRAENMFKTGKFKSVSIWQCVFSLGDEEEPKEYDEDEEIEDPVTPNGTKNTLDGFITITPPRVSN